MAEILIPVLLSLLLGPGVGQLYNREYRKGGYLIALSLIVLIAAFFWFWKAVRPDLPPDLAEMDPMAINTVMRESANRVVQLRGKTISIYYFILIGLWVYSVVDAYFGGIRRKTAKQTEKTA
jgi:TM2 domain-containing membrane protein YozV